MPRVPTQEETRAFQENRLDELWDDVCSSPEIYRFASGLSVRVNSESMRGDREAHFQLLGPKCSVIIRLRDLILTRGQAPHETFAEGMRWARHPANRGLLRKEWERLKSLEISEVFFDELEHKIRAPLDMRSRICIAGAIVGYRCSARQFRQADRSVVQKAKRLVKLTRREVVSLRRLLKDYDSKLRSIIPAQRPHARRLVEFSVGLHRECCAVYQNARQRLAELESLSAYSTPVPDERLAVVVSALYEALRNIEPPFWAVDCETALSILDKLLARWGVATSSSKGQNQQQKALNDFIVRLGQVFEDATGMRPTAGGRFFPYLNRILAALPPGMYHKGEDGTLLMRVRRLMVRTPTPARQRVFAAI